MRGKEEDGERVERGNGMRGFIHGGACDILPSP